MGTPGQTHTASFSHCLSAQINSHSSRALSCLKLHLWIIDHLLPERPQFGIMRIKTRAAKTEWEKCKRVELRRRADTGLIPVPGQNPSKHLFCQGVRLLSGTTTGFFLVNGFPAGKRDGLFHSRLAVSLQIHLWYNTTLPVYKVKVCCLTFQAWPLYCLISNKCWRFKVQEICLTACSQCLILNWCNSWQQRKALKLPLLHFPVMSDGS